MQIGSSSLLGRLRPVIAVPCGLILLSIFPTLSFAQDDESVKQGHSIGTVSTQGNLIVMELDDAALGKSNLFDLVGNTLRFTPEGSRYRVEKEALQWDLDSGPELAGAEVTLHQFAFPFSGQHWSSFRVGRTGSIRFGEPDTRGDAPSGPPSDGGVSIGRFDPLGEAADGYSAIARRSGRRVATSVWLPETNRSSSAKDR